MTLNVILNGARGGQGASTVAAVLALHAAGHVDTQLVAHEPTVTAALLGVHLDNDDGTTVTDQLTLASTPTEAPVVRIVDSAVVALDSAEPVVRLVVLRGPCYLALRTLVVERTSTVDGIVVLVEPGRSLTARDVADVAGAPVVATVAVSPAVARTIDAGLLVAGLHRLSEFAPLRHYITRLLDLRPSQPPRDCNPTSLTDLNDRDPETVDMSGTDLPVALCATGGGSQRGSRQGGSARLFLPTPSDVGKDHAQHRQAQCGCRRLLHRRGCDRSGGLLHRPW